MELHSVVEKLFPEFQVDSYIDTGSSVILFSDKEIVKCTPIDHDTSNRARYFLNSQDIPFVERQHPLGDSVFHFLKMDRISKEQTIGSLLFNSSTSVCEELADSITQHHAELSRSFPKEDTDILEFLDNIEKNFALQKARSIERKEIQYIESVFNEIIERLTLLPPSSLQLWQCHGDYHPGNMYLYGDSIIAIDPSCNNRDHYVLPKWGDIACIAGTMALLGAYSSVQRLRLGAEKASSDFSEEIFLAILIVKSLVRVHFERNFVSLNKDRVDVDEWRIDIVDNGFQRLATYLELISGARKQEHLNHLNFDASESVLKTLQDRRVELSTKSTVLLAATGIIFAASATISVSSTVSEIESGFFACALLTSSLAAFRILNIIRRMPKKSKYRTDKSNLFFFKTIARDGPEKFVRKIENLTVHNYLYEIGTQATSLSKNIEERYNEMSVSHRWIYASVVFFLLGVLSKIFGLEV